mgnify:CR=1 FL=1
MQLNEKIILILALKSAYTINDEQIEKIYSESFAEDGVGADGPWGYGDWPMDGNW